MIVTFRGDSNIYKVISSTKTTTLVEDIETKQRKPVFKNKSLPIPIYKILVYTKEGTIELIELFKEMYNKANKLEVNCNLDDVTDVMEKLKLFLPNYDEEKIHYSHAKKIIKWYNKLIRAGFDINEEYEKYIKEKKKSESNLSINAKDKQTN